MSPKLLFLQTEDWTFWSHRLPLARAAKAAGYDVHIALRIGAYGARLSQEGFHIIALPWRRKSVNPFREISMVVRIIRLYSDLRPDIVHQVAVKPILYGSIAARLTGVPVVVNTLTGLGFAFTSNTRKAGLLRRFLSFALRLALSSPNSTTIFQNSDDLDLFLSRGIASKERSVLVPGSGVDVSRFVPAPETSGIPLVVLPARMLWDKGVGEFVEAAKILAAERIKARFALVGEPDLEHLEAIPLEILSQWARSKTVECWGKRDEMSDVFAQAHVVCLPSYREGLPKALIEAAACARPLVAFDVPGCREVVIHEQTGLLVPARDSQALAAALRRLIQDASMREKMGRRARELAIQKFAQEKIVNQTLALYRLSRP